MKIAGNQPEPVFGIKASEVQELHRLIRVQGGNKVEREQALGILRHVVERTI